MYETLENLDITDELIAERRSAVTGGLPGDMVRWMAVTIGFIDTFNLWVGRVVCLTVIPMCLAIVYEVLARKFFIAPTIWAYDVSCMLYGAMFVLGSAYALSVGVHIRADFLYRNWSPRTQGMVDTALYILMYFPGMAFFLWTSSDYAFESWERGERGMDTAWMPLMWPVKSSLPIGIAFLLMQGVSELLKCLYAIRNNRWPV